MAQPENLVFCGTPQFAVPTLEKLAEGGFNVRLVLTQPDRPKGRGLGLVGSPVKETALRLGLPTYQPERIKENAELQSRLAEIAPSAINVPRRCKSSSAVRAACSRCVICARNSWP